MRYLSTPKKGIILRFLDGMYEWRWLNIFFKRLAPSFWKVHQPSTRLLDYSSWFNYKDNFGTFTKCPKISLFLQQRHNKQKAGYWQVHISRTVDMNMISASLPRGTAVCIFMLSQYEINSERRIFQCFRNAADGSYIIRNIRGEIIVSIKILSSNSRFGFEETSVPIGISFY